MPFDLKERYMRPMMLERYKNNQEKLLNKKVGIIGVGGLGGLCSLLLALAGVGHMRIADGDVVALHNLHRQILFNEQDIGSAKALGAKREILARQSAIELEVFDCMIDESNFTQFTQGLDVLLDLSDNALSRIKISQLALEHKIDLISGAVSAYSALIAIFNYHNPAFVKEHGCYCCMTNGDNINTKVGITGPLAAMPSSMVANLTLDYLLGDKRYVGKLIRIDMDNLNINKFNLARYESCPYCSKL